jgi:hypothetical protein
VTARCKKKPGLGFFLCPKRAMMKENACPMDNNE